MKSKSLALLGIGASLCASGAARAESFQSFYKTYMANLEKAMHTHDIKFFESIYTADFKEKTARGTQNRAQEIADMRQQMAMLKDTDCKVKLLSSKVSGSKATTTVQMRLTTGAKMPDGKYHKLGLLLNETETWVKVGGTWKQSAAVDGPQKVLSIDGQTAPGG